MALNNDEDVAGKVYFSGRYTLFPSAVLKS